MLKTIALRLTFCLAFFAGTPALADNWSGEDKGLHFAGSATLAVVITAATENPWTGFWSAVAVGVTKEIVDSRRSGGQASGRDLVADVAGAYLGSQAGRWLISRRGDTTAVVFAVRF